jgi:hypothetical protein
MPRRNHQPVKGDEVTHEARRPSWLHIPIYLDTPFLADVEWVLFAMEDRDPYPRIAHAGTLSF